MRRFWTPQLDNIVRRNYPSGDRVALAKQLGVTRLALIDRAKVLGVKCKKKRIWTTHSVKYLREHYADTPAFVFAEKFGCCLSCIYDKARSLGLKKSKAYRSELGRRMASSAASAAFRFKPGHVSSNKGLRQSEYMTPEAIQRSRATQWKKGHLPHNAKPVGYERTDTDGYVRISVPGHRRMVFKHRWVWEQHNGPIPKGYLICFRDGNRQNCDISNLELVTRSESMRRCYAQVSPEERHERMERIHAKRRQTIRRDKLRIRYGLAPRTNLVKYG